MEARGVECPETCKALRLALVRARQAKGFFAMAQGRTVKPVTQAMLQNPPADDWLMYSRTYDAQRYSPLNQINKQNVGRLTQVWKKDLLPGAIEIIPIVHGRRTTAGNNNPNRPRIPAMPPTTIKIPE